MPRIQLEFLKEDPAELAEIEMMKQLDRPHEEVVREKQA